MSINIGNVMCDAVVYFKSMANKKYDNRYADFLLSTPFYFVI